MDAFKIDYKPLVEKWREFRLVRFEFPAIGAPAGSGSVKPKLQLRHFSRNTHLLGSGSPSWRPNYEALSYVWGDSSPPALVEVNGRDDVVGQNLYAALQQLYRDGTKTWIWIDALCINQADNEEKSW